MGDALTPERLAQIRAELAPEPNPTCRICGKPMVVGAADAGGASWNCPGGDWRTGKWTPFDDTPDRGFADAHYSRSEVWRSHPPKFAVELLAEVDRLTARVGVERAEEYEVISSEDRTEYSLVTVDTAPDDPRRIGCPRVVRRFRARSWEQATGWYEATMEADEARAGDVARIVGWLRDEAERASVRSEERARLNSLDDSPATAIADIADAIERGDWRDQPADPRPHSDRVRITPAAWRRMEAAGFVPGTENPVGWLVRTAEETATLRAAARAVLSLTGDEPMEEADAAWTALAGAAGVPEGIST